MFLSADICFLKKRWPRLPCLSQCSAFIKTNAFSNVQLLAFSVLLSMQPIKTIENIHFRSNFFLKIMFYGEKTRFSMSPGVNNTVRNGVRTVFYGVGTVSERCRITPFRTVSFVQLSVLFRIFFLIFAHIYA